MLHSGGRKSENVALRNALAFYCCVKTPRLKQLGEERGYFCSQFIVHCAWVSVRTEGRNLEPGIGEHSIVACAP